MPTSITFPNGQTLISTALTTDAINTVFQALTTQMLGVTANADSTVRLDWPTGGQPGYAVTDDLVFLRCTVADDDYNRLRDRTFAYSNSTTVAELWAYTRVWAVAFTVVGPNSLDNARLIKSALLLDFAADALTAAALYLNPDMADPIRAPELFQGQWWERVEFDIRLNEAVTETIEAPSVNITEIDIADSAGNTATILIQPAGYGIGNYGSGNYGL